MRTGADYVASLRDGRSVILDGEVVRDVTTHPAFRGAVKSVAHLYDTCADPARRELFTFASPSGAPAARWWQTPRTVADLTARRLAITALAEETYGFLGRSPDHVASFFAGFAAATDVFAQGRPQFGDNVARFYDRARDENLYISYTIIHPTVDRTRPPHEQYEPNLYVSVAREHDDGIVLRGAQMLGTGSVMSDYIFVSCILPLPPGSEDYAVSLVVPNGAPGLRIYSRRSYASGNATLRDYPLSNRFDETDSLVVFDDVFVPWEDVFVYRDIALTSAQFQRMAAHSLGNTQAQTRFATKLRFFAGLARQVADGSGVSGDPKVRQKLGQLAGKCSIPEAFLLAGETSAALDEFGVMRPDPAMLYSAMTLQPTLMNEITFMLREMTGGSVIQLPSSYESWQHDVSAADIERYIRWPERDASQRVALLKLVWDAIGSEFAGRHQQYEMFYAGESSVVQMRSFGAYPWDRATALVDKCLASLDER